MAQLIAGMYEIQKQIGAGGGGIVYLGLHTRLNKIVVLKADKRRLSTNMESLRREVDMLKNLSHTYIPQVYDFVQEDGVVYTVMDYIEGESLDKLIGRGEIPSQPQVIEWACQLLEALVYLHGQPPHGILHADIKPANIMLRPNGTICLIDYNIALALGEDGAVKVGFSRGYASPEHYGADYISANRPAAGQFTSKSSARTTDPDITELDTEATEVEGMPSQSAQPQTASHSTTGSRKSGVMLDARSDIYSLGATLYHLISGVKPGQDAREVQPLGPEVCSPAVSAILAKAMAPMPEDRYQTAAEMLEAFHALHTRDARVTRHKHRMLATAAVLSVTFLAGGVGTFIGSRQMEQRQEALTLSEYSANALAEGDITTAVRTALQAIPDGSSLLDAPVTTEAQRALTDALGVYDLSDGFQALDTVTLPGAPFTVRLSPEGSRFAVVYAYETAVYDTQTLACLVTLPAQESALSDVVFVSEDEIIYAGADGVTAYDLAADRALWTGEAATTLSLSADGTRVAAVDRDATSAVIYEVADGSVYKNCDFGGKHLSVPANDIFADAEDDIFALNADGTMLAVSSSDGDLILYVPGAPDEDLILLEGSDYTAFAGGFCGDYFAFTAAGGSSAVFGLVDVPKASYLGGFESQDGFLLHADADGIFLASGNTLVSFDPDTLEQTELAYTDQTNIRSFSVSDDYVLVTTEDQQFAFYDSGANRLSAESYGEECDFAVLENGFALLGNRDKPLLRALRLENHAEAELLAYDARYAHNEARISADGQTAMLFDYQGFCIYTMDGTLVTEVELQDAEQIYDQQFRKEDGGSYLEVIWYDGTRRHYSAADGQLLEETQGEAPDESLLEEFVTDNYRIVSSLHDAPVVYDKESGEEITVLESDAYLTYVTQVGEYIITEYISAEDGSRYGLLLNEKLETLAKLPELCDVSDGQLVFDYESGNLRQSRIYSLSELVALGEAYK